MKYAQIYYIFHYFYYIFLFFYGVNASNQNIECKYTPYTHGSYAPA